MRYLESNSVDEVLAWLEKQGCKINRRNYQVFHTRVLHLMTLDQARELKVNVDLLRAVRVRYKLPVDPKGGRVVVGKATPRHDCRQRRRRILPEPRPKHPSTPPPLACAARMPRFEAGQLSRANTISLPSSTDAAKEMRGTPDAPQGYGDWKIVNEMARDKLALLDRHLYPNMEGTVIHLKTRKLYTAEELVSIYKITLPEAQSCFMTFNG